MAVGRNPMQRKIEQNSACNTAETHFIVASSSDGSVVSFQKTVVAVIALVVVFLKTAVAVVM